MRELSNEYFKKAKILGFAWCDLVDTKSRDLVIKCIKDIDREKNKTKAKKFLEKYHKLIYNTKYNIKMA